MRRAWPLLAALAIAASIAAAHGQTTTVPNKNEIGPQTAVPAPLPPGSGADTPGGSAKNGIIRPPPVSGDPGINRGAPGAGAGSMPVIRPPGTLGGNQEVIPK
jgi:hypothetical protein